MWGCRDWSGAVQTKGCRQPAEAALGKEYTLPKKSLKEILAPEALNRHILIQATEFPVI